MCHCGISFTYVIESIDLKLISVCLINDYSLIADLHTFVYGHAECASIYLECTKVKFWLYASLGQYWMKIFLKINIYYFISLCKYLFMYNTIGQNNIGGH